MNVAKEIAINHFGKKNIKNLNKLGYEVISLQEIPGKDGTWLNSSTAYVISYQDCAYVKDYFQVLEIVKGA